MRKGKSIKNATDSTWTQEDTQALHIFVVPQSEQRAKQQAYLLYLC
jgi:hypothetical protein